jgi:hypothetical protein
MDMNEVRRLYDQQQRIDIDYAWLRREAAPRVIRLVDTKNQRGTIIYSQLDETTADETIRAEIAYFKSLGMTANLEWKLFDYDLPADLKERLVAQGFVLEDPDAVLILDLETIPPMLLLPVTHDVQRLTNPDQLGDVLTVLNKVWEGA